MFVCCRCFMQYVALVEKKESGWIQGRHQSPCCLFGLMSDCLLVWILFYFVGILLHSLLKKTVTPLPTSVWNCEQVYGTPLPLRIWHFSALTILHHACSSPVDNCMAHSVNGVFASPVNNYMASPTKEMAFPVNEFRAHPVLCRSSVRLQV